ncbi:DMT family transporter [Thalassococcus sp. S3]|uniref:DMT family transporter n=1 Tax=Thalassococcus sp. S3 TaxID=2017482 RepID=UPI00102430C0|nr:DMT family transporter [Thalassococcus sp. S3]QBF31722.1 EamA family transporter [Thalassococcus sp. S3]
MSSTLKAALWMIGAIASFTSMAVAGREVSFALDTFEIMMYRSFVGVIIVVTLISVTRSWAQVTTRSMGVQMLRNAAHFTGQNLWFYAVTVIPLAQVFALEFTSPLWVIVLSPLILGERLTLTRVVAALIGFSGILIVARPGAEEINLGVITAASAAIFFAITITVTKRLTRTESIACILFWLTVMQAVLGVVFVAWDGDIALPDATTAPWLILIGIAGLLAHYCMTNALAIAPATVVVPIDFVRLPTIAVIGMLLYAEPLDLWVFVGALVIFAGNYLNIWSETKRAKA